MQPENTATLQPESDAVTQPESGTSTQPASSTSTQPGAGTATQPASSTSQPLISFVVPCYNVADYVDHAVQSILDGIDDHTQIEIILVNDGSTRDNTAQLVDAWQSRYPNTIHAVHQANGGHGEAVNTGISLAQGLYVKVLDADDWFDAFALRTLMTRLRDLVVSQTLPDLIITNYVYEKLKAASAKPIRFSGVLPTDRVFTWSEVGRFAPQQNLLMHTALYRTEVLRSVGLKLPSHTFYVDNIFVYLPLPAVKTLYYLNVDLYRYFIGRDDQSVQESTMISRIDQQLRVTRIMIDAYQLQTVEPRRLRDYMSQYLLMMLTICSVFLRLSDLEDREEKRRAIWQYLRASDPDTYYRLRGSVLGLFANLPGSAGRQLAIGAYRISQKIYKFN